VFEDTRIAKDLKNDPEIALQKLPLDPKCGYKGVYQPAQEAFNGRPAQTARCLWRAPHAVQPINNNCPSIYKINEKGDTCYRDVADKRDPFMVSHLFFRVHREL
jgi:hypothetical protein